MESNLILAMAMFALSMSISPGPANMVIVASGANHGIWRTLPFVSGATLGFTALLVLVGMCMVQAIQGHPLVFRGLGVAGALFIAFVGWKIATSRPELDAASAPAPSFIQGVVLQWLNPKAWIACAAGAALFSDPGKPMRLALFVAIYFLICYLSLAAWAVLGDRVSLLLRSPRRIAAFNLAMGGMLIATAGYMLYLQVLTPPPGPG